MKHKFSSEYDGSLVCDHVVVVQPDREFPKSAIEQIVKSDELVSQSLAILEGIFAGIDKPGGTSWSITNKSLLDARELLNRLRKL